VHMSWMKVNLIATISVRVNRMMNIIYKHVFFLVEPRRKSMSWPNEGKGDPIATAMVPANRMIRFESYSGILSMVQRNTMPLPKNFLRLCSNNSASQGFTTTYMSFPLLLRYAKDHASPQCSFINSTVIALLLRCQPVELEGFTVPHEPLWHASLLLQRIANKTPAFQFWWVLCSWWKHKVTLWIMSVNTECPIFRHT
jgi:hypothetical protein